MKWQIGQSVSITIPIGMMEWRPGKRSAGRNVPRDKLLRKYTPHYTETIMTTGGDNEPGNPDPWPDTEEPMAWERAWDRRSVAGLYQLSIPGGAISGAVSFLFRVAAHKARQQSHKRLPACWRAVSGRTTSTCQHRPKQFGNAGSPLFAGPSREPAARTVGIGGTALRPDAAPVFHGY